MLYFAYGSNLDPTQMRVRCPQARDMARARLDGYRLCFPRWSAIRASALASLEPARGEAVWGVLYELDAAGIARLDACEGYRDDRAVTDNAHTRATVMVGLGDGRLVEAETYLATPSSDPGMPSSEYLAYLLQLADARDLPADYREKLRNVETVPFAA